MKNYNWGIIGAGRIAHKFANGLKELGRAHRYAVAARDYDRADAFARQHGFGKAYGSYEDLLADPELDIVYIATTNNLHFEHTMMCLEAGKAVLCEKPFAMNLRQVELMIAKAREKNVFLMEALWSRFLPSMIRFKEEMERGSIGRARLLQCEFGFISPFNPDNRIYNRELGGGSVPDIGIYPLFVALYLFGYPTQIRVVSLPSPTGSDLTTSILLKHPGGDISMLASTFNLQLENEAKLYGDGGCLKLHRMFHMNTRLTLDRNRGYIEEIDVSSVGNGYNYEIEEVMRCLDAGWIESPMLPFAFSLELMRLMEEVLEQIAINN